MTTLTVSDLFTPAPSGVGAYGNVPAVPAAGTWLAVMLDVAGRVGLPTTAFQSGSPERTILAVQAVTFAQSDLNVSLMAQGGYLQSAASGSVTYTADDGTNVTIPVTPDPSNAAQNPTGALGWLDLLAANVYNVDRLAATYATGPLAIVNLKSSSVGPFAVGGYHVANAITGATYHNAAALTIPSSTIAGSGGSVVGVLPGFAATIVTTSTPHGLATGDVVYLLIPTSSGVSLLAGVFATVAAVTSYTFQVSIGSSGTYTSGGQVYLCTLATMIADVAGTSANAANNSVTTTVTQNAGVFCSNPSGWAGSNWESNSALSDRCVLSLAVKSPNGPSQAYVYYAETAQQLLANATPAYLLTHGPVSAVAYARPLDGLVGVVVASATPASTVSYENVTPGCAQLPVSGVSNANPAIVSCAGATSLALGQQMVVTISGVLGIAGVNGTFTASYVSPTSFSIPVDTTAPGSGAWAGGGSVEGGDLGQIDALIQANVVPDNTVCQVVSALAFPLSITATVVVPQAYAAAYRLAVATQLQRQIDSYSIGGNAPAQSVPYDDIVGALEEAGVLALGSPSYVRQIQGLLVNGGTVDVPFPNVGSKALLSPAPVITVLGV